MQVHEAGIPQCNAVSVGCIQSNVSTPVIYRTGVETFPMFKSSHNFYQENKTFSESSFSNVMIFCSSLLSYLGQIVTFLFFLDC